MFQILNSIKNVKSSLVFSEGTVIAKYNHGSLNIELVTTGSPIIEFEGQMYDDIKEFPPALMFLISSGRKKEVNVVFGNKYELIVSKNNEYIDNEVLPDISGYSDKKLEQLMAQTAMDYVF